MRIIDSHFHIYKSEQAGIMAQGGKSLIGFSGTLEEAGQILDRGRINKILALAVIPIQPMRQAAMKKWPEDISPQKKSALGRELENLMLARLSRYNEWLCQAALDDDRIEPVIAVDPTINENDMVDEILDKLEHYSVKALKIHPAVNRLLPTHEGYQAVYELAQEKELTVISHGGLSADDPVGKYCAPENFRKVLDNFPNLKLVVAHLAFPKVKSLVELASQFPNLYTDISFVMSYSALTGEAVCEAIRGFGTERVIFGSDFPWADPEDDADRLLALHLKDSELEMVSWKNAAELFRLS